MKVLNYVFFFSALVLSSCTMMTNITKGSKYGAIVGRPLVIKNPMKLYEIDFQLNGYKDRHDIGSDVGGQPLVGLVQPGETLIFDRIVRFSTVDAQHLSAEGTIRFNGKSYPIAFHLIDGDSAEKDNWKTLEYYFVNPR